MHDRTAQVVYMVAQANAFRTVFHDSKEALAAMSDIALAKTIRACAEAHRYNVSVDDLVWAIRSFQTMRRVEHLCKVAISALAILAVL